MVGYNKYEMSDKMLLDLIAVAAIWQGIREDFPSFLNEDAVLRFSTIFTAIAVKCAQDNEHRINQRMVISRATQMLDLSKRPKDVDFNY